VRVSPLRIDVRTGPKTYMVARTAVIPKPNRARCCRGASKVHPISAHRDGTELLSNAGTISSLIENFDGSSRSAPKRVHAVASEQVRVRYKMNATIGHAQIAITANQFAVIEDVIDVE
jgi:hypothetical protein